MLSLEYKPYTLHFKFIAGTSRGIMTQREVWFIRICDTSELSQGGIGEVAPLFGLSVEDISKVPSRLAELSTEIEFFNTPQNIEESFELARHLGVGFPSIQMGLEMALLDLVQSDTKKWFSSPYIESKRAININGLVWMGNPSFMREQIQEKISAGFDCIKLKIGALDFEQEIEILKFLKSLSSEISVRVDANGAFLTRDAKKKLELLNDFDLHSIEQPIKKGQWDQMKKLTLQSKVPIALDEELIGIPSDVDKVHLLDYLQPAFVVLKPSLLGGFAETSKWITYAEERDIGWWVTSALESNIGLNAISQFVGQFKTSMAQGLGTGQLYHNNLDELPFETKII
jgi:o-succinylbenzoate synthase